MSHRTEKCSQCGGLYAPRSPNGIEREALTRCADLLCGAHADCWEFFQFVWRPAGRLRYTQDIGAEFGVSGSTLNSRFLRAGLPSPRAYLLAARLTRAARRLENPAVTGEYVSSVLGWSSSQAFCRTVRNATGLPVSAFRETVSGSAMLARFCDDLIAPYRATLLAFMPTASRPRCQLHYGESRIPRAPIASDALGDLTLDTFNTDTAERAKQMRKIRKLSGESA